MAPPAEPPERSSTLAPALNVQRTQLRIGVDTGGTFTDLVALDETTGERRTVKVPSTPARPVEAVFTALAGAEAAPEEVSSFVLGTTIATNCLLQRRGARTVYVTTAGFEDVPFIQRINRLGLYDMHWDKPRPYVRRADCIGVRERLASDGTIRVALEPAEVERVVERVRAIEAEDAGIAVAVNLLFAYLDPGHERTLAAALTQALPGVPVSVSSDIAPVWREYERGNTTIVDAYLRRMVGEFTDGFEAGLAERGLDCPRFLLKSNGGQIVARQASTQPVQLVLSGLAGGMIAGRHYALAAGRQDALTLDMGGTSADVGVVLGGVVRSATSFEFEFGLPIAVPVVDLTTVGAGGSSLVGFDRGGLLQVGPASAGADPGPAAYGRGGEAATVTDANLVLGRLHGASFLGGRMPLDENLARAALQPVAERLGASLEDTARAVIRMAVVNMANAVRLVVADRGLDARRLDLVAFGGAGPLHAALLAQSAGLAGVVVPPHPGLASAFGAMAADMRVDRRLTIALRSDRGHGPQLAAGLARVAAEALDELRREGRPADPSVAGSVSCRYRGQNFERDVVVPLDAGDGVDAVAVERFHLAHETAYGYRLPEAVVEFVHVGAVASDRRDVPPDPPPPAGPAGVPYATRPVCLDAWGDTPIYRREVLAAGQRIDGPAVIEEVDSTTLVLDGWVAEVHPSGCLVLHA